MSDILRTEPTPSPPLELRLALLVEGLDAFAEILRGAQPAVAVPFHLDAEALRRILGVVQQLLGGALGERREAAHLGHQCGRGFFELVVQHAFRGDAPIAGLTCRDAARASIGRINALCFVPDGSCARRWTSIHTCV